MRRMAVTALALVALALALPVPPPARSDEKKPEFPLLAAGRKALAEGKIAEARSILLEARSFRPEDPEILGELLRADGKDPEARFLWFLAAAAAASDTAGRAFLPKNFPAVPPEEGTAVRALLQKRAAALQEVRRAAKAGEGPAMGSYQAWLRRVAERLADGSPVLRKEFLVPLGESETRSRPDREALGVALRACIEKGKATGKAPLGLEAARVLRGLRFQASQREAMGGAKPKASTTDELGALDAEVQAFREEIAARLGKPFTAAEILAVPLSEGPEFQRRHATLADPGVAISPRGLYRIETTGGLETLQATVRNIERCHARLVRWCGSDPFGSNQGRVRLRPTYSDMESDGEPYWWAGGWQQGRLTTVHTCFTDALSLSGVLTHELTHRFDGTLHPGLPAWLMEGRAVHAETCTSSLASAVLDESRYERGALVDARNAGYGDPAAFVRLLEGTGDYRDNYSAGYALWIFLTTFRGFGDPAPSPIFASRVAGYIASCAPGESAGEGEVARFRRAFADGAEGRPATLELLARQFGQFLDGVSSPIPERTPAWVQPWEVWMSSRRPPPGPAPKEDPADPGSLTVDIFDRSNWPKARVRSAPAETGTEQARLAAAVFRDAELPKERVMALEWAVAQDDPTPGLFEEAVAAHAAVGGTLSAWALRRAADLLFVPGGGAAADPAPKEIGSLSKAAGAVVDALDAETDRALARGAARLGLALRADRDDLATLLGLAPKGLPAGAAAPASSAEDPAPFCGPWTSFVGPDLAAKVWAPLAPKPSSRFHLSGDNSLVLGATEDATGDVMTDWFQNVFVESAARLEGTYSIESSWRAESPFFEGILVVGKEGEDRGLSITLSGGDSEAAARNQRSGKGMSTLNVSLSDSRPLEGRLSPTWAAVPVGETSPTLRLVVVVSGPSILVSINGEPILRHRRLTGAAIRGTVGFGVRHGTVDVVNPRFRRHRAAGDGRLCACGEWDAAVPWNAPRSSPFRMLAGRRLEPAAASPGGGLLYWYTEANLPFQMGPAAVRSVLATVKESLRPWAAEFGTLFSFPPAGKLLCGADWTPPSAGTHGLQPEFAGRIWRTAVGARAGEFAKPMGPAQRNALEEEIGREIESPWCLWIDPDGIVRRFHSGSSGLRVPGLDDNLHRYFAGW